jgi:nucleolar protein 12
VNGSGDRTLVGRAGKLLGRAGASQLRKEEARDAKRQKRAPRDNPENDIVIGGHRIKALEGHRARANEGKTGLKFAKKGKSTKPTHRGAKRGEAWKKAKKDT